MTSPGINRNFRLLRFGGPGAGNQWSVTPGGQRIWRVVSMTARLVTSAVVGNRRVRVTASDGGHAYYIAEAHLNHPASTTVDYAGHTGSAVTAADNLVLPLPLPGAGLLLRPGAILAPSVTNFDVGDAWSAIVLLAEEIPNRAFLEGDQLTEPAESIVG